MKKTIIKSSLPLLIIIIGSFLTAPKAQASFYEIFVAELSKQCQEVNSLAVKKALIKMTSANGSCDDVFIKSVLDTCSKTGIDCEGLYKLLAESKNRAAGNVIGKQ